MIVQYIKKKLKDNNIQLVSVIENIDGSPEGILLESVIEGINEYYSENLSREIKKGKNENALKCLHNGGIPPFGYDVDARKKYIINEKEAIAVKKIFDMYIKDYTYSQIIDWLDINCYKTKNNREFKKTTLPIILKNKKYIGTYTYGDKNSNTYTEVENAIPLIIDKGKFFDVQKKLISKTYSKSKNKEYILTGKLKCEICGGSIGGYSRGKGSKRTYYCNTRKKDKTKCARKEINAKEIEEIVLTHLEEVVFSNKNNKYIIESIYKQYNSKEPYVENENHRIKIELKDVETRIQNILSFVELGQFTKMTHKNLEKLENKREKLLHKLKTNESKNITLTKKEISMLYNIGIDVKEKNIKEKKKVIDIFVEKITFDDVKNIVNITYKFDKSKGVTSTKLQHSLFNIYAEYLINA